MTNQAIPIPEFVVGNRNNTMMEYARALLAKSGWSDAEIADQIRYVNTTHCKPPLSEADVNVIVRQVERERARLVHGMRTDPHEPCMEWTLIDGALHWRINNADWMFARLNSVALTPERIALWHQMLYGVQNLRSDTHVGRRLALARAEAAVKAAGFDDKVSPAGAIRLLVKERETLKRRVTEADDRAVRARAEVAMTVRDQYRTLLSVMGAPSRPQSDQTMESLFKDVLARIEVGAKNKDVLVRIAKTLGVSVVTSGVPELLARIEPMIAGLVAQKGLPDESFKNEDMQKLRLAVRDAITLLGGNPDLMSVAEAADALVTNVRQWRIERSDRAMLSIGVPNNQFDTLRQAINDALRIFGFVDADKLALTEACGKLVSTARTWATTAEPKPIGHASRESLQTLLDATRKALDDAGYSGAMPEMVRNLNAHRNRAHERAYKFRDAVLAAVKMHPTRSDDEAIAALTRLAQDYETGMQRIKERLSINYPTTGLNALLDRLLPQFGKGPTSPEDEARIRKFLKERVPTYEQTIQTDVLNALLLAAGGWHTDAKKWSDLRQSLSKG